MNNKKYCPFGKDEDDDWGAFCFEKGCAVYDESRKCCGMRQIASEPRISIRFPTGAPSVGGGSGGGGPLLDKPIATLHDDGSISGEWAGGTIAGGWSQGTGDEKGGAEE